MNSRLYADPEKAAPDGIFSSCVVKRMIARAILHAQRAIDVALGALQVNVPTEQ
jgi:hypothetical protein